MARRLVVSPRDVAVNSREFCFPAGRAHSVAARLAQPSQLFRIVRRTVLSFDVCPLCGRAGCQRLLPDSYLDQGQDCRDSSANEMGDLGIIAGSGTIYIALC